MTFRPFTRPLTKHNAVIPLIHHLLKQTFSSLSHRNYRLWFFGQMISLFGTWMQSTAQGYLLYQLTKSPIYLGYVGFASGIPTWLFTLFGGVTADRMSKRAMLLITQISMMILAFILATLTFLNLIQPWHILILAFCLGIANAFDAPARQSIIPEMVGKENLANAIALNSTMFNTATAVGPAIGGLIYAALGPGWCFTINGISFIAVIFALLLMHLNTPPKLPSTNSALNDLKEGLIYVAKHPIIRLLILNLATISLFGFGMIALIPAWAVNVLKGDSVTNGLLLSARGIGALIGALMIASLGSIKFRGKLLAIGSIVMPVFMMIFSLLKWIPLSLITLGIAGWGWMVTLNLSNVIVQTTVQDELRGRVMGVYTLTFFGLMPMGSLISGAIASRLGEPTTVMMSAFILLVFSLVLWVYLPALRRQE